MRSGTTKLTPKGSQTKQRIIEAATRLVDARGAARTSLDDVREEAGVSSSQIYHYFSDKQSLMLAVIDRQHRDAPGDPRSMLGSFDSVAAVRAWAEKLIDQQRHSGYHGCPIVTLGSDPSTADPRVRMRIAASLHRFQDHIRAGYRSMQADGEISAAADPNALASMTLTSVMGGLVLTQLNRDTTPLSDAFTSILHHMQEGEIPKSRSAL